EAWTFAPVLDLRVIRGDPRRGRTAPHEVNQAVFEGPFVARVISGAPRGTTQDPTWSESLQLTLTKAKGLYVHVVLSDNRFGVGLGPLAELVITLGEVLDLMRAPSVSLPR
ncbi:Ccdc38, partial [Symbiodinium pilosum]